MLWYILAFAVGLIVLVRSADLFVEGAAGTAAALGMSPLLIGMLVVGFGTSAPEMLISGISAFDGAPGIALGNAWGSNVANIGLILGVSALVSPLAVQSRVLRHELPVLIIATVIGGVQVIDGRITRVEAVILLVSMVGFIVWSIRTGRAHADDPFAAELAAAATGTATEGDGTAADTPPALSRSLVRLTVGLILLVASSRALVWGAVGIASAAGVSDLVIGLTVIALGTSLPELASSIAAVRQGEDDIALGNVIGSNMFNTLAVVGIGAVIRPIDVEPAVLTRDLPVMALLTVVLLATGIGTLGRPGRVSRLEGGFLLTAYVAYIVWVAISLVS